MNSMYSLFGDSIMCMESLGSKFAANRKKLEDLGARLQEGRFHLAVLGQFKRGKSTFLNALLGDILLPSSVLPLTAIPVFRCLHQPLHGKGLAVSGIRCKFEQVSSFSE